MGLDKNLVRLEAPNPDWPTMFLAEAEAIRERFGKLALSIEHVGSTSIPGIYAKPIIDIAVGVKKLKDFERVRAQFEVAPYSVKPDPSPGEQLIRKGEESNRLVLIHVMELNGKRYQDTILFRDYLRTHPNVAREYEKLKQSLAKRFANDRPSYTAAKNDFIQAILRQARGQSSARKSSR